MFRGFVLSCTTSWSTCGVRLARRLVCEPRDVVRTRTLELCFKLCVKRCAPQADHTEDDEESGVDVDGEGVVDGSGDGWCVGRSAGKASREYGGGGWDGCCCWMCGWCTGHVGVVDVADAATAGE